MFSLPRLVLTSLTLSAGLLLAGCQSGGTKAATTLPATQAVSCSKCKTVFVREPRSSSTGKGSHIVGYRTRRAMTCPDCKDAVESFFATGKFQHTCKTCGDTMELCEGHTF
jgi:ribosomal protein S27E